MPAISPSVLNSDLTGIGGYLVATSSTIPDLSQYAEEMALIATLAPTFTTAPISKIAIGARSPADSGAFLRMDYSLTVIWTDTLPVGSLTIERYATTVESLTLPPPSGGIGTK